MNKDPLNFGVSGIFGRMGQNPSINALTNANALAQQQLAQQQLMQPLTATILAAFLFSEILNLMQILFVLITFVGIYLARLSIVK